MENICIPMHLDAFALSPDCCTGASRIAPFTQPNYTALRLDSHLIQHDVVDHIDFHTSSPATKNPRMADIGLAPPNNLKYHRMGIHLHWSLPRFYRAATASGRQQPSNPTGTSDPANPTFRSIPNRWLVTRHLKNFQQANVLPEYQSWVVESDAVRRVTTIPDNVDLESDVSPFVSYQGNPGDTNALNAQTEVFLGQKFDLAGWQEDASREHMPVLTLMNSSNPLFADYALHNTNVLSIIDNFAYKSKPTDTDYSYLNQAQCDYFVIGWHSSPANDPLNQAATTDLATRLSTMMLRLDSSSTSHYGPLMGRTRCLCYSAIYDVKYNSQQKPRSLADESATKFTSEVKMEPLSVGTTPLDGVLTFLEAHKSDADAIFGTGGSSLASEILQISQLLYATADQYDYRVQAQDLIAQQSYAKADGGVLWTFAKAPAPGGTPAVPSPQELSALRDLNEAQTKLDAANRKLRSLRWELFAEWWKYVSEYLPLAADQKAQRQQFYRNEISPIKDAISGTGGVPGLLGIIDSLNTDIEQLKTRVDAKAAAKDAYYTRTDPTLCIAGLDSGLPQDFLDVLAIQLEHELSSDTSPVDAVLAGASNPVTNDHGLQTTARRLLAQCLKNSGTQNGMQETPTTNGFQAWGDKNPFVPLFIEWESIYYHVDIDKWDVQLRPSPVGHAHPQVRYAPNVEISDDPTNSKDIRSLSGRVLVLPQPVFSLENIVSAVLATPSPDITLTPDEIDNLKRNIRQIKFISAPLSGLTSHLLTRCEGAHVKPNVRVQGQKLVPLQAAAAASQIVGLDSNALQLIDAESAFTPYGSLMAFGTDLYPKNPFKPVTHGQMLFTKLNIVDKFGQAICLPSPKPRLRNPPSPPQPNIYPCLSDYLSPDVINGRLNTVFPSNDVVVPNTWPLCAYMQLTPSINQDARINASFLMRDTISKGVYSPWRQASEYENCIWGWIIINYADSGLQFFQGDGTFYAEIRMGGVHGSTISSKWLPFTPPASDPTDANTAQLAQLLAQFNTAADPDGSYLQNFFDMINGSIQNMPFPPSDYSGYANAIVGKPLALVNAGWSIEMAAPAIQPQNSTGNRTTTAQADLEAYQFAIKIGDLERTYDGVVGYYLSSNTATPTTDWSKLYTYFVPHPNTKVQQITPDHFPKLNPYYLQPETTTPSLAQASASKFLVTSLLIDPYTALHGYSPILPTKTLTLPPWTIQTALRKLHAFFHLGPSLLTADVPRSLVAASQQGAGTVVKLPVSGRKGTWTWLQPYANESEQELDPGYAQVEVQEDLGDVKFEKGPYTFLEGFLLLAGDLGKST